jgi:hypothetical protein
MNYEMKSHPFMPVLVSMLITSPEPSFPAFRRSMHVRVKTGKPTQCRRAFIQHPNGTWIMQVNIEQLTISLSPSSFFLLRHNGHAFHDSLRSLARFGVNDQPWRGRVEAGGEKWSMREGKGNREATLSHWRVNVRSRWNRGLEITQPRGIESNLCPWNVRS